MINQFIDQPINQSIGPSINQLIIALACCCTVRCLAILKLLNETVYDSVYILFDLHQHRKLTTLNICNKMKAEFLKTEFTQNC